MDKDIIVIGGGPGGYTAAIRASQCGYKVGLVERDALGGTCLNRGCIPTKALYKNAEVINTYKELSEFGINTNSEFTIDVGQIHARKGKVMDGLRSGIEELIKANKIELYRGNAGFVDKNTLKIELEDGSEQEVTAEKFIIATGSAPIIPPIDGADIDGVYTSDEILSFKEIPQELLVVGGGVIGMEIASIFNSFGSKVTVVEFLPKILGQVDTDVTKRLQPILKKKGISINTSTGVTKIEKDGTRFKMYATSSKTKKDMEFEGDAVLICTGRKPVTEGLNLDEIGVEFDRKGISTDENFKTSVDNIFAIGDVNGKGMLAHIASNQGIRAVEHIAGIEVESKGDIVPACIFIFPEIATVGLPEDEAKVNGIEYRTNKFMFAGNGKAMTMGETAGYLKLIASKEHEDPNKEVLLGAQIMGPHASDLIHECTLAIANNIKLGDIKNVIHAHPTLSEVFIEALTGLVGEGIHSH
ncbi:MAG: dihydrolipoyl dehydrogenase [Clostridioides sp.]|jgi:dihydrolipoamide dehydrogenase|nr:dihydrolipoyl dehydrogenase [Clostridioides sp.]